MFAAWCKHFAAQPTQTNKNKKFNKQLTKHRNKPAVFFSYIYS